MKEFIDANFMLHNSFAKDLYHIYSEKRPVIDYHCHLSPKDIAMDRRFNSITEAWLKGDHYKWRAMRTNGISEKFITGQASDYEKFEMWAETVPYTLRNPLYHWSHLELNRYFDVHSLLSKATAREIYNETTEKLQSAEYSVRNLLLKMNVEVVCTTDDPIDDLQYHQQLQQENFAVKVIPAWRPDKAMAVENVSSFNKYLDQLEACSNKTIDSFDNLMDALAVRHEYFHQNGCRLSDHGLDTFYAEEYTESEIRAIFLKLRDEKLLDSIETCKFKSAMLFHFGVMDAEAGWVQQFHIGALRSNNSLMLRRIGPDTGFDSIGDQTVAGSMAKFLDKLNSEGKLARTILYNLNPAGNEVYATMTGNFQDGSVPGKIQWGAPWWFLDQKFGMEKHLDALSSLGLLSRFVGMLTDSRSFLSFPRHEYFRRILCNILGNDIEKGELPEDINLIGEMVSGISYQNARKYFDFWK